MILKGTGSRYRIKFFFQTTVLDENKEPLLAIGFLRWSSDELIAFVIYNSQQLR
jgi:hypothetical protein